MTADHIAEAMFKAWTDLSFIPHVHVERMREAVKRADTLPFEQYPLALMLLLTEDKTLVWTTRRVSEGLELTSEAIH